MDKIYTVALFGEAEKGEFNTVYFCQSLPQLEEYLGNPPPFSRGLFCAVQALLYKRNLLFFRVQEEGFSCPDYLLGLELLGKQASIPAIEAVCLPGVGDGEIINATIPFCKAHHSILLTSEADLYDYLTNAI